MPVFVGAFEAAGLDPSTSRELAGRVRGAYVDSRHWRLFNDAVPALRGRSSRGWTHLILSNHVLELPRILREPGLDKHLHQIFNSAQRGYEKPHPRAFGGVLEAVASAETAWMVGDNPEADVRGAEAIGLPAILVRGPNRGARHHCEDLTGIVDVVERA